MPHLALVGLFADLHAADPADQELQLALYVAATHPGRTDQPDTPTGDTTGERIERTALLTLAAAPNLHPQLHQPLLEHPDPAIAVIRWAQTQDPTQDILARIEDISDVPLAAAALAYADKLPIPLLRELLTHSPVKVRRQLADDPDWLGALPTEAALLLVDLEASGAGSYTGLDALLRRPDVAPLVAANAGYPFGFRLAAAACLDVPLAVVHELVDSLHGDLEPGWKVPRGARRRLDAIATSRTDLDARTLAAMAEVSTHRLGPGADLPIWVAEAAPATGASAARVASLLLMTRPSDDHSRLLDLHWDRLTGDELAKLAPRALACPWVSPAVQESSVEALVADCEDLDRAQDRLLSALSSRKGPAVPQAWMAKYPRFLLRMVSAGHSCTWDDVARVCSPEQLDAVIAGFLAWVAGPLDYHEFKPAIDGLRDLDTVRSLTAADLAVLPPGVLGTLVSDDAARWVARVRDVLADVLCTDLASAQHRVRVFGVLVDRGCGTGHAATAADVALMT